MRLKGADQHIIRDTCICIAGSVAEGGLRIPNIPQNRVD